MPELFRRPAVQTIAIWLLLAAILGGWYALQSGNRPLLADSDDAMRMVTAMDLLGGQPWQDNIVLRDNAPVGASMHWSRLIDAPIAALTAIFGPDGAAIIWPLLLLLPLVAIVRLAVERLAPRAGPLTLAGLLALSLVVATEFAPGRVDHHNVQMVLVLGLLVALLLGRRSFAGAAIAGLIAATCLAIGMETITIVAAAGGALAFCWLIDPISHKNGVLGFAVGIAAGAVGHWLLATPPAAYFAPACDVLSITYVAAAIFGGAALTAAALLGTLQSPFIRIALLAIGGAAAIGLTALLFPHCLAGPYADVDPRMLARVFPGIPEAQPLWTRFAAAPATALVFSLSTFAGLVIAAWLALRNRGTARQDWLILLLLLAAATLMMLLQIRGARLAAILAVPALAWLTASAAAYVRQHRIAGIAVAVAAWLVAAPILQLIVLSLAAPPAAQTADSGPGIAACRMPAAYADLAALPAGIVAAPASIASHILRYTPHAVVSAGFHRNGASVIDNLDFLEGDEARALDIANERNIAYAVTCGENAVLASRDWLEPAPTTGPLRVYRRVR